MQIAHARSRVEDMTMREALRLKPTAFYSRRALREVDNSVQWRAKLILFRESQFQEKSAQAGNTRTRLRPTMPTLRPTA
jgi:hypothetical protein